MSAGHPPDQRGQAVAGRDRAALSDLSVSRSTRRSAALFDRALEVLVDGVASPSRGAVNYRPYPLFMARGEGPTIVDADGNRYLDLMLAYGSLIHGHPHPRLVDAIRVAAGDGALLATATEVQIEFSEQ